MTEKAKFPFMRKTSCLVIKRRLYSDKDIFLRELVSTPAMPSQRQDHGDEGEIEEFTVVGSTW